MILKFQLTQLSNFNVKNITFSLVMTFSFPDFPSKSSFPPDNSLRKLCRIVPVDARNLHRKISFHFHPHTFIPLVVSPQFRRDPFHSLRPKHPELIKSFLGYSSRQIRSSKERHILASQETAQLGQKGGLSGCLKGNNRALKI